MTCMSTENWRSPNSRKKFSVAFLLRLSGSDMAVVLAESGGEGILSQRHCDYQSHFPLSMMQNDLLHVETLYNITEPNGRHF